MAYAAVVGGANVDICGRPLSAPVFRDSNPGTVRMSLGGVGRNVAHNLRLMGVDTRFFTALGEDDRSGMIVRSCGELGIDISEALTVPGGSASTYLYLTDDAGEMVMAVSDMALCDEITPEYLASAADTLNRAALVVADANIPTASLQWLAENCRSPVFADPVSTKKAKKLKPVLGMIHTLKPNRLEAEILSGVGIQDEDSLRQAAEVLLASGLSRVFITLGKDGLLAADHEHMIRLPCPPAEARNTTGAGDAFVAGLVLAYLEGASLRETALLASSASALTVEYPETIYPAMSSHALRERLKSWNI